MTAAASADRYRAALADQGLPPLTDERLAAAVAVHQAMRPDLEALRAVPLPYLEPVSEPASALAWLERGGAALDPATGGVA